MKNVAAGLGLLCAIAGSLGCSGSHSGGAAPSAADESAAGAGNAGCTAKADCKTGVCSGGQCKDVSCAPNTTFCGDGGVWACAADGTPTGLSAQCSSDQFCLEKSGTATCNATSCFGGDGMCVGNVATQCKPDGSGPKPGGTDCTVAKQTCYSGECRDLLCTPGQKLCDNDNLYLCSDAGTSRVLVTACGAVEVCDATSGACQNKICDPGKFGCDSTRVVTCNSSGSAWTQSGPDCAANQGVCIAGACQPTACTAGSSYCQDDAVYSCSSDGTIASLSSKCGAGMHCVVNGAYAFCDALTCQPGQASCNGSLLATCNADGTDWLPGGTDCSLTSAVCTNNQCTPTVCTADALFCKNDDVQQCDGQGLTFAQYQFCPLGTTCLTRGASVYCAPTPCSPDTDACAGEKLGLCASDGMSITAGATDCGAAKEVCTLLGCAKSAVDTISAPTQLATVTSNEIVADILDVQSARKLTQIEANLSMPSARSLVWAVYEQTNADGAGEFDLELQKTTPGSGTGFQSSGAISVELQAGKAYAIGVSASDGGLVYYFDVPNAPSAIGFAHVVGSVDTDFSASFDYSYSQAPGEVYVMRLTTTPP